MFSSSFIAVGITDVESSPVIGDVIEERPVNPLTFNVLAIPAVDSSGLIGSNLWQLTVFGSNSESGEGPELNPQQQALIGGQLNVPLKPGSPVDFGPVNVNYNMMGVDCASIGYICARLRKNPAASVDYTLNGSPDESVLVECQPLNCRGKSFLV